MNHIPDPLLIIDTSTQQCVVVLKVKSHCYQSVAEGTNVHSKALLDIIDDLIIEASLRKSDIKGLAVGVGPGSFTSLRIGIGVAQGLAFALLLPVLPFQSLHWIARSAYQRIHSDSVNADCVIAVVNDARMSEVYLAVYRYCRKDKVMHQVMTPCVLSPSRVKERLSSIGGVDYLAGNAIEVYPELDLVGVSVANCVMFDADALLPMLDDLTNSQVVDKENRAVAQQWLNPQELSADYVRVKVAETTAERESRRAD